MAASTETADKMKAIAYTAHGDASVIKILTLPRPPAPGPGEVLVRVAAGGLNPIDTHERAGTFKLIFPATLPAVAGNELSGTVVAVGTQGSARFKPGDRVVARVPKEHIGGALAEYVVLPVSVLALAPTSIALSHAAGLPLAGLTALQALEQLEVGQGDTLLVTAGAGGVGLFAIQLAKLRGATVFTTASTGPKGGAALVTEMGADTVIDYKASKLTAWSQGSGTKFSKVFDLAGGDMADLFGALAPGAHVVTVAGPPMPGIFDSRLSWLRALLVNAALRYRFRPTAALIAQNGIKYEYLFMRPDGAELGDLSKLVDEGRLRIVIDSMFPFAEFAKAFARLDSRRSKGKVVIEMPSEESA